MAESTTKLELIAILDDVFRTRGYEGATLTELSRACNLGKASLYHHFPGGKEEMATLLLRRAIGELNDLAFRQLDRPGPWRERIAGFVDGFSRYCRDGSRNCLVAEFTATAARSKFGDAIRLQTGDWLDRLTRAFTETGAGEKRARRRARELLSALYGALVISRLLNDPAPYQSAAERLRKELMAEDA